MTPSSGRRIWSTLCHPTLGIGCALFTGVWCGLGSALGRWAPNFHHRHVAAIASAPRWHGLWMFVLSIAVTLWLLHSMAGLRVAFASRRQGSAVARGELAFRIAVASVVMAFAIYGKFVIATPSEQFAITTLGTNIHGEFYRTLRIESLAAPERIGQQPAAWLERRIGTAIDTLRVERGSWWPSRVASYELALARGWRRPEGAVFRHGQEKVTLTIDHQVKHGVLTFLLRALQHLGHRAAPNLNHAELEVNGKRTSLALDPEWAGATAFLGQKESPVVVLRVHRTLSRPLAIWAVALIGLGWGLWKWESRPKARQGA